MGTGAASWTSEGRSRAYGMLPSTERSMGLPLPRGGDRTGRLDHGGHQNDQPISTHRLPMLITSGVDGMTYASIADCNAGLLISNFIFAAMLPPTPAKVGGSRIWASRFWSTSSTQRLESRSYPQPVSAIQQSGRERCEAQRLFEAFRARTLTDAAGEPVPLAALERDPERDCVLRPSRGIGGTLGFPPTSTGTSSGGAALAGSHPDQETRR